VAKYGVNYYGATKYGAVAKLVYSVEPMSILVLDFARVFVQWQTPQGNFSRVRLVRNQAGFAETAEDGVIVFDEFATEGTVSRSYIIDGEDNPESIPFVPGRQAYYRFFIFTDQKVWRTAGSITVVIPSNHSTQEQFMNTLPRVFTTAEQSPLGAIDTNSALYSFMGGLMFAQEEAMTYLDLLRPIHTGLETPFQLLAAYRSNYGLTPEPALPIKNQKRLIREALYMYSRKGTELALGTYIESLTGYNPTITVSPNLLLSVQDSTFYNSVGNWVATNAVLTSSNEQVPVITDTVIDTVYSGKVVAASSSATITLGEDAPITKGIPVNSDTDFVVGFKIKSPTSAGSVTRTIKWYDRNGTFISSANGASLSANNTWKTQWTSVTSPANAVYATLKFAFSAAGTYYIDQIDTHEGTAQTYNEARAVDIFLNPYKTNFVHNPSFETNVTDGWTLSGSAVATQDVDVSDIAYSGSKSAKIVATGTWSFTSNTIPIEQGTYYTNSGLIKSSANLNVTFVGRDGEGNIIETEDLFNIGTTTNWSQFTITHLTDAFDAGVVTYELVFSGGAGTYYLDCIQFEKSIQASDYFDGNLPSDFGAVWEGSSNNSATHLYPTKLQKVSRLGKTLVDWLPMNTFWIVRSYAGVEYTNLTV
jgi:hypothetical protein